MKKIIAASAITAILGTASLSANATGINNGDTLTISDGGSETIFCLLGTPPPCTNTALDITVPTGSYFVMGDRTTSLSNFDGIVLGSIQPASGAHAGIPDGSESPGIDVPWDLFTNTGMHQSLSPTSVISQAELDFSGWSFAWRDEPAVLLGGCQTGDPANNNGFGGCDLNQNGVDDTINTSIANITITGDTYILNYFANVPAGDPSNLGGATYTLRLEGTIIHAIPVPAAIWLFASGILALSGVARRRKKF